jgi:hypothetical protein
MSHRNYRNNDPREIRAKYDCICAETGKPIKTGEICVYYPSSKSVYHVDSKQAYEFRNWKADIDNGYNY